MIYPILKHWISEDYETVREASKRRPRNEVARFIIQDLDSAYYYMKATPPMSNRLTKDCAALMKSRVALFEGYLGKIPQRDRTCTREVRDGQEQTKIFKGLHYQY